MFSAVRLFVLSAILTLLTGVVAHADVLILANGDRLKGTVVRNVDGMITFKSDILGEIVLPTTKASVEYDLSPEEAEKKRIEAEKLAEAEAKKAAEAPPPTTVAQTAPPAAPADRSTKVKSTKWTNRVEFGLTSQSGRTEQADIALRTESTRKTIKSEARLTNRVLYGKTDGITSTDSIFSNLRYRKDITPKFFFQSNTSFDRDAIKLQEAGIEQGVGVGKNLFSRPTMVIKAGIDIAERYRSYLPAANGTRAPSELETIFNVFQDMSYTINSRFSMNQDFSAVVAPGAENDYKINFNAGLTGKITNTFNITTRLELEYDRNLAEDLRYNQRLTTTLVYVF